MFEEIVGEVGVGGGALVLYAVYRLVSRFRRFRVRSRRFRAEPAQPQVSKNAEFPAAAAPGRSIPEQYQSRGLGPCRCAELAAPAAGSLLSAGTAEECRNDDQPNQPGAAADTAKGNQS